MVCNCVLKGKQGGLVVVEERRGGGLVSLADGAVDLQVDCGEVESAAVEQSRGGCGMICEEGEGWRI